MMATDVRDWTPGWTDTHSQSYGLREAQVQVRLDKPGPGYWWYMRVNAQGRLERVLQTGTRAFPDALIILIIPNTSVN
jgi:hypothetical protein